MHFATQLRLYWANKTINYSLLILIALLGVIVPAWYWQLSREIIPLVLGVIAAALAESDASLTGRLKSALLTLCCFALSTFSVELLFRLPWLFALGLFASTVVFIMLGAVGARYASIAFGSLLISVYTMLGAGDSTTIWFQPTLLLIGAGWYYVLSMVWLAFWPMQPVQQDLSHVFDRLGDYLMAKSQLFHPVHNLTSQPYRLTEAKLNAATVTALNQCKATLLSRSKRGHVDSASDRFLNIYFMAQDIHERVSSTHYHYQKLAQEFQRSDVMFRFEHLMQTQAEACRELAQALRMGKAYQRLTPSTLALEQIQEAITYLQTQNQPHWAPLLAQLRYLFTNLATVEKQLNNMTNPDVDNRLEEGLLEDTEARSLRAMWLRIRSNFTLSSLLFRHALRLAIALTIGYGVIQGFELERGYWILLTTLFVCQPNYAATRQKLIARISGTIAGLLIGVPLLSLFPSLDSQLVLIAISGVLFFAFRINNYSFATGFITLFVLFCFNQLGQGFAVVLPRLGDTLLGCALAVAAVSLIFPDWQSRRLPSIMADAIESNQHYLAQIIGQYRIGKKDSLSYRIARRHAHNSDANLTNATSTMLAEPGRHQLAMDESFRFLTLNHALLSYISAMGAHRTRIDDKATHQLVLESHRAIHHHLGWLATQLRHRERYQDEPLEDPQLERRLSEWRDEDDTSARMVLQQLHLIHQMLPEMHELAQQLAQPLEKPSASS